MRLHFAAALLGAFVPGPALGQNSGARVRPEPSEIAARAGSAIEWRSDLDAALEEAVRDGKPVLWYVPTLYRSFMDRKPEIDRYMLAGPFSWPRLIDLINAEFVPVRFEAGKAECERFGLEPIGFIEPGLIVLSPDGSERAREDRLTTHHPAWYAGLLAPLVGRGADFTNSFPGALEPAVARELYSALPAVDLEPSFETRLAELPEAAHPEARYLFGAGLFHSGREADARATWEALVDAHPEHPLAWKAAMELEGHGPLVHGFEVYADLPEAAFRARGEGTSAPAGLFSAEDLWRNGVQYLAMMQRAAGGFEDSTYDFGGTDGLPNVFMAVTAIAATALLEREHALAAPAASGPDVESERALIEGALERAFAFMADESNVNSADTDEQIWAHVYRLRCLCRWLDLRPSDANRVRPLLERIAETLIDLQGESGAWAHEYSNPFVTANCLIALYEVKGRDVELEGLPEAVAAGTSALLLCRTEDGAYSYGQSRPGRKPRAQIEGSVGRTPLGELALARWVPEQTIGLEKAVALSFEHEHHLVPVRKYDDHTRNYAYGGFFFWYDLHARVEAIAAMNPGEARKAFAERQRQQILGLPEFDGVFVDSHEIGRVYGTSMALWCLAILDELD